MYNREALKNESLALRALLVCRERQRSADASAAGARAVVDRSFHSAELDKAMAENADLRNELKSYGDDLQVGLEWMSVSVRGCCALTLSLAREYGIPLLLFSLHFLYPSSTHLTKTNNSTATTTTTPRRRRRTTMLWTN